MTTEEKYDPFTTNRPEDVLRMMAIAAALVPALDGITAAKKAGVSGRAALERTEEALRDFEDTLHELGFEVVLCPARDPKSVVPGLLAAIGELKDESVADPSKPIN